MQLLGSLLRRVPVVDCILEIHIKARLASIFLLPGRSYWRRELDVSCGSLLCREIFQCLPRFGRLLYTSSQGLTSVSCLAVPFAKLVRVCELIVCGELLEEIWQCQNKSSSSGIKYIRIGS